MRLLIVMLMSTLMNFSAMAADSEWELEKEESEYQLKIYTREIAGSSLNEFKGEMLIETKLKTLAALLLDSQAAPEWIHQCESFEIIEQLDPKNAIIYFINGAPWPVSDRDAVVSSSFSQDPDSHTVRIDIQALDDRLPEDEDYVRIPRMKGHWAFTPQGNGQVLVRYQVHAEPGGSLPAWLANSVVVDTPYYTMTNMVKMLKRDKYQQADVSFINNVKQ
jgi:hypothetical protein